MDFSQILSQNYFGNSVENYLIALAIILGSILIAKILKFILEKKLSDFVTKTPNKIDDLLVDVLLRPIVFILTIVGLYVALEYLAIPESFNKWIKGFFQIIIAIKITSSLSKILVLILDYYFEKHPHLQNNTNLLYISKKSIAFLLWLVVIILIITNLGYNVNSLIAGLGIGGIAIALAAQNILGDLFSSISIFVDKPFQIGDFIVVGTQKGTVKSIGMKTTRLTTLQGEELVLPNALLTAQEVQNFRKMKKRRIVFQFGVLYETPLKKLKEIPQLVKEIFEDKAKAELDRVHFSTLGDFSLNFEVVYFLTTGDYNEYMDMQQSINLDLMESFEKHKIQFAYPTQKIFVAK